LPSRTRPARPLTFLTTTLVVGAFVATQALFVAPRQARPRVADDPPLLPPDRLTLTDSCCVFHVCGRGQRWNTQQES